MGAVGIFSRRIDAAYAPAPTVPLAVASPWMPSDALTQWTVDQLYADAVNDSTIALNRDIALRIPGVKRAHGIHVKQFAGIPFFRMDDTTKTAQQPAWLTTSRSGVSPYHRMYGVGSDLFFNGWACLGFDRDPLDPDADCMHAPYGSWGIDDAGSLWINESIVPSTYTVYPVAIPLGYGENGLLVDGIDTLREARLIEAAYIDRVNNPTPLTVLGIPQAIWESWTPDERKDYRDQYVAGRKSLNGSVSLKVAEFPIEFPGQGGNVDLFESGRNAVRLDIANHTGTPASLLEGVSQGGSGGSDIKYTGVANGLGRSELWDFGLAKGFTLAFEARMSLDDICAPGLSIRGDLTNMFALPEPNNNPTSQD